MNMKRDMSHNACVAVYVHTAIAVVLTLSVPYITCSWGKILSLREGNGII